MFPSVPGGPESNTVLHRTRSRDKGGEFGLHFRQEMEGLDLGFVSTALDGAGRCDVRRFDLTGQPFPFPTLT